MKSLSKFIFFNGILLMSSYLIGQTTGTMSGAMSNMPSAATQAPASTANQMGLNTATTSAANATNALGTQTGLGQPAISPNTTDSTAQLSSLQGASAQPNGQAQQNPNVTSDNTDTMNAFSSFNAESATTPNLNP